MAPKKRVRKAPITSSLVPATESPGQQGSGSGTSTSAPGPPAKRPRAKSSRQTQSIISTYHTLLKRRKQLLAANEAAGVLKVDQEIAAMGGLDAYQKASQMGQTKERGGDSGRVLVPWLQELGWGPQIGDKIARGQDGEEGDALDEAGLASKQTDGVEAGSRRGNNKGKGKASEEQVKEQEREVRELRMLEIGAVRPDNYASYRWIHVSPIDINSQHPLILQQDFFDRPIPIPSPSPSPSPSSPASSHSQSQFHVISCSLVLNFVDDPHQRGRMLRLMHQHLLPDPSSLVFLVLPLPCVNNSRYLDRERLVAIMEHVGFKMVKERWKPDNKVGYWLWSWQPVPSVLADGPGEGRRKNANGGKGELSKSTVDLHKKVILRDGPGYNNFAICL